jgi:hypothetical protein
LKNCIFSTGPLTYIFVIYDSILVQIHIKQMRNMPKKSTVCLEMVKMVPMAMIICIKQGLKQRVEGHDDDSNNDSGAAIAANLVVNNFQSYHCHP